MKTSIALLVLALLLPAQTLNVVTTQPDLADLARRIGGEAVSVQSLTEGDEDLHYVRTRPSILIRVRRADLFVELGRDAEHAWVPALIRAARNRRIQPGQPGFVDGSVGLPLLEVPDSTTRDAGADLHRLGNPHYNLDPENMVSVARRIRDALIRLRPAGRAGFEARCRAFEEDLQRRIKAWSAKLAPFKGAAFVENHPAWSWFANRFGLRVVARLEPKPGLAPTPGHLAEVIGIARREGAGLVVARPVRADVAAKVAREVGARSAILTLSSTTRGSTVGYLEFMDHVVDTFAANLRRS